MSNKLPIARLISVMLNRGVNAAQAQNTNTLLVLGSSAVIDTNTRYRIYYSLPAVATDFGTSAPEYLAAQAWFGQSPQPQQIMIGRWAQAATAGALYGAAVSAANQAIAVWNAITAGSMKVTVNGTLATLSALNFSAASNLNAVAAIIQAALTNATCVWNATYSQFVITSTTTGASSTISFASATGSGTDISVLSGLSASDSGSYIVGGIVAESAISAVTLFDSSFGQQWYGLFVCGAADTDHEAISPYIEAATNKHVYGVNTQEAGVLVSTSTTDIAYVLSQSAFNKTMVQYSGSSLYAVCSLLGRQLTVNYAGNSTVITLMYEQEPGITAETLNTTQIAALEAKNCNVFVAYDNNTTIIEPAVCSSGEFIDFVIGGDNLAIQLQTAVFNLLYTATTKIPQTDAGMHQIVTVMEDILRQFVANGFLAPGVWNTAGFGTLVTGAFLAKGFYVYAPPVSSMTQSALAARQSVPFQIAAKCAGAVHTVGITINFN